MVNPRYAAANPWANVATDPERRSKTVAARSIKSIIGMEYRRNELIRFQLSRYLQVRPAAKNNQNATSQAKIVMRSIVLLIYRQKPELFVLAKGDFESIILVQLVVFE